VQQRGDDGAAAGFDAQADGPPAEALFEFFEPAVQVLGGMLDGAALGCAAGGLQGEVVGFIAPIQTDPGLGRWGGGIGFVVGICRVVLVHVRF
jgi:hypothetical protein